MAEVACGRDVSWWDGECELPRTRAGEFTVQMTPIALT